MYFSTTWKISHISTRHILPKGGGDIYVSFQGTSHSEYLHSQLLWSLLPNVFRVFLLEVGSRSYIFMDCHLVHVFQTHRGVMISCCKKHLQIGAMAPCSVALLCLIFFETFAALLESLKKATTAPILSATKKAKREVSWCHFVF